MPRPRIRPENRQRAVKACVPCKTSKKRCDSGYPCASCVRRDCIPACIYHEGRRRSLPGPPANQTKTSEMPPLGERAVFPTPSQPLSAMRENMTTQTYTHPNSAVTSRRESSIFSNHNAPSVSSSRGISTYAAQDLTSTTARENAPFTNRTSSVSSKETMMYPKQKEPSVSSRENVPYAAHHPTVSSTSSHSMALQQAEESSVGATPLPQSRMMLNSKGEKVYLGDAASLSFLQFLRQILTQHMGPSRFTENKRGNVMLEADTRSEGIPNFEEDFEQKRELIDSFFIASSGILDLYSKEEMNAMLAEMDDPNSKETGNSSAAVYLAIAIGGQCLVKNPVDLHYSKKYFTRGQQAAFEGMLEDPSINLIRVFLLMSFYLLGACKRNAAFMYLGVAARAAHALGLHVPEQYRSLSNEEQALRSKVWKSLRILDLVVSSILGRASASLPMPLEACIGDVLEEDNGSRIRRLAIDANFQACSIIEEIVQNLSQTKNVDIASAEQFLDKLNTWSANLSNELRSCSIKAPVDPARHEVLVGNLHVACIYYFAVMLVTRPFLISFLMSRLPNPNNYVSTVGSPEEPSEVAKLAQICIDSAIFMAQTCQNTLAAGLILDNMCLLKAWLFAAGLVLGFSMFADGEVRFDMEDAFNGARDVLEKISHQSPQAEHYYEILTNFSDAISKHRQQIAQERRRTNSQYINQILYIDVANNQEDQQCATPTSRETEYAGIETDAMNNWWNTEMISGMGQFDGQPDSITANWDNFALQISENFPLDGEPFRRLFEDV